MPDGRSVRTLFDATPIRSAERAVETVVVTVQDLAPFEELERSRAECQGMVSHELRAQLAAIKGSAATALGDARDSDRAELRTRGTARVVAEPPPELAPLLANSAVSSFVPVWSLAYRSRPLPERFRPPRYLHDPPSDRSPRVARGRIGGIGGPWGMTGARIGGGVGVETVLANGARPRDRFRWQGVDTPGRDCSYPGGRRSVRVCPRKAGGRYTGAECSRMAATSLRATLRKRDCQVYAEESDIRIRRVVTRIEPAILSGLPRRVPA